MKTTNQNFVSEDLKTGAQIDLAKTDDVTMSAASTDSGGKPDDDGSQRKMTLGDVDVT